MYFNATRRSAKNRTEPSPSRTQGKNWLRTYVLSSRAQTIYYSSSPFPIAFKLSKGHTSPFILWKKRTYSVTWWDITFEQRHFRLNDFTTTYYSLHTAGVPDRIQKHNTVDKNEKKINFVFIYYQKILEDRRNLRKNTNRVIFRRAASNSEE